MLRSQEKNDTCFVRKIIYRANREKLAKNSETPVTMPKEIKDKIIKNCADTSPTPVNNKYLHLEPSFSQKEGTQNCLIDSSTPFIVYGKRKLNQVEIRETKRFKANAKTVSKKTIKNYDPDTKATVDFSIYNEHEIIDGLHELGIEDPCQEDGCLTSSSQTIFCKDFLTKQLEEALINA